MSNMLTEPSRGISLKRLFTTPHPSICRSPGSKKDYLQKIQIFCFPDVFFKSKRLGAWKTPSPCTAAIRLN